MEVKIIRDYNNQLITIEYKDITKTIPLEEYVEIIRSASRIEGSGKVYLKYRNKLVIEYLSNEPKEQFSW